MLLQVSMTPFTQPILPRIPFSFFPPIPLPYALLTLLTREVASSVKPIFISNKRNDYFISSSSMISYTGFCHTPKVYRLTHSRQLMDVRDIIRVKETNRDSSELGKVPKVLPLILFNCLHVKQGTYKT